MHENISQIRDAARKGDYIAQYNLAVWHINGGSGKQDAGKAHRWLSESVKHEFPPALALLGELYLRGLGVTYDPQEAARCLHKAAAQRHTDALLRLGELYMAGLGVTADPTRARGLFSDAAKEGHVRAIYSLAYCLDQAIGGTADGPRAIDLYFSAARTDPHAQAAIALRYETGEGLPHNPVKALCWYTRAAENGYEVVHSRIKRLESMLDSHDIEATRSNITLQSEAALPGYTSRRSNPEPEVISWEPRILYFSNFLRPDECWHIITKASPLVRPSTVVQRKTGEISEYSGRTSEDVQLVPSRTDVVISNIEERIARYSHIPASHSEPINVLRYGVGSEYVPHCDYFDPDVPEFRPQIEGCGQRIATFLVYLNDVERGGATRFTKIGLDVTPEEGKGLLFYNCKPDGAIDPLTMHSGAPVEAGVKWLASRWFRASRYS